MCIYPLNSLIFIGVLIFILKIKSRYQLKYILYQPKIVKNLNNYLSLDLKSLPHNDTINYLCKKLDPANLEILRKQMIQKLIRMKKLTKYRLFNEHYLIALDGTGNLSFNYGIICNFAGLID